MAVMCAALVAAGVLLAALTSYFATNRYLAGSYDQDFADIPEAVVAAESEEAAAQWPELFPENNYGAQNCGHMIGFVAMALAIIIKPTCKNKANGHA